MGFATGPMPETALAAVPPEAAAAAGEAGVMASLLAIDILFTAILSFLLGAAVVWWRRRGQSPNPNPIPIKPLYPNRVLIVLFGTIGLLVAINVIPRENVDAAVASYFILLGNVLSSMKGEDGG